MTTVQGVRLIVHSLEQMGNALQNMCPHKTSTLCMASTACSCPLSTACLQCSHMGGGEKEAKDISLASTLETTLSE